MAAPGRPCALDGEFLPVELVSGGHPLCCIDRKWGASSNSGCPGMMKYHLRGMYGTDAKCDYGQTVLAYGMKTFPTSYQAGKCMGAVLAALPTDVRESWPSRTHTITLTVRNDPEAPGGCSART